MRTYKKVRPAQKTPNVLITVNCRLSKYLVALLLLCLAPKAKPNSENQLHKVEREDLPDVYYSLSHKIQVSGESVVVPLLDGFGSFQQKIGEDCPVPRFRNTKLSAGGWSARGKFETDPFDHCATRVKEISFVMAPHPKKPLVLREVTRDTYTLWKSRAGLAEEATALAKMVLEALTSLAGMSHEDSRVLASAGGDNNGFPFVAGRLRVLDSRGLSREFYFALAVTVVGKTWAVPVVVADTALTNTSVSEDVISLAKAMYLLNRDYRGPGKTRTDSDGPFLSSVR